MPKIVDHDKHREQLLTGCFSLLSTKGYAAITMREIADGLGVSTGSLYHYFPNKQAILEQMFVSMSRRNVSEALNLLSEEMSGEEKLTVFQKFWKDNLPFYQKLLLLAVDYHRTHAGGGSPDVFADFIMYYQRQILANLEISEKQSAAVVTFVLGTVCQTLLAPKSITLDSQTDYLKNTIISHIQ